MPSICIYNVQNYNIKTTQKPVRTASNSSLKIYAANNICFKGLPEASNIILNYNNDVPNFIYPIDVARKILGRKNVYDMAIGNPDIKAPQRAINKLCELSQNGKSHRYSRNIGSQEFRNTIAAWYEKRFKISGLNPDKNIITTGGGANGIDMLLMSYCNAGDKVLIPNIGYPVYRDLIIKNNLTPNCYNMKPQNNYQIDFSQLEKTDLSGVKAMIINYPHNPTGVFATDETLQKALDFCREHDILLIHDFDSSELSYSGTMPKSILEFDTQGENSAVVHTMSKSHNMPGMRVGFVISNPKTIQNLLAIKNISELSTYVPIQEAASEALTDTQYIDYVNKTYRVRKETICKYLKGLGLETKPSEGTYYMWIKLPEGFSDLEFSRYLLYKGGLALTPGRTFNPEDTSHVRIVMSQNTENIEKVFNNLKNNNIRFDIPKNKLDKETIEDIESYSHPIYSMNHMFINEYQTNLLRKVEQLKKNYHGKPDKYQRLIPSLDYIYNAANTQKARYYSLNSKTGKREELFTKEILPFSSEETYQKLKETLEKQWIAYQQEHPEAKLLNSWANLELFPHFTYITVTDADGKIQSVIGFKKTDDKTIRARLLNTAPWNQTKDAEFKNAGKVAMVAEYNYAKECGINNVIFEVAPHHVNFYKWKFDAEENGKVTYNGKEYTKLIVSMDNPKVVEFMKQTN